MMCIKRRIALVFCLATAGLALDYPAHGQQPAGRAGTDLYGDPLPTGAIVRLGSMRLRHSAALLSFSPDGKTLISASQEDASIRTWEAATGKLLRQIRPAASVTGTHHVALACAGKTAAVAVQKTIRVWDALIGKELCSFRAPGEMGELTLSQDGKILAGVVRIDWTNDIQLWDVLTGKELCRLRSVGWVEDMALSPDGRLLGIVLKGETLLVWDIAAGKEFSKIRGPLQKRAFSPDGKYMAADAKGAVVKIWNVADGSERGTVAKLAQQKVRSLAFSPDSNILAVGTDEELGIWSIPRGKQLHRIPTLCAELAFAPDGKVVASASNEALHLWNVATGKECSHRPGHDAWVQALAVSPDGQSIATIAAFENAISLWDAASGKRRRLIPGPRQSVTTCAFSPDGKLLLSGGKDGMVRLWEIATGNERRQFSFETGPVGRKQWNVYSLSLSPKGDRLHALAEGEDCNWVAVWDVATGKSLARWKEPRGTQFLSSSARRIVYLDWKRMIEIDTLTDQVIGKVDLSEKIAGDLGRIFLHSEFLVAARGMYSSDPFLVLIDLALGEPYSSIKLPDGAIDDLVFAADGRTFATAGRGRIRLWDAITGKELLRREYAEDSSWGRSTVGQLAFFRGGERLAAGFLDGTILVWDLEPKTWRAGMDAQDLQHRDLQRLWYDLSRDVGSAHRALWTLMAVPAKSVPFLAAQLRPAPSIDPTRVERLLARLDSVGFTERQSAVDQLTELGEGVAPALRKALAGKSSLELRKRLEAIQDDVQMNGLRIQRAIRALEHIGTDEAQQVLKTLSGGDPAARPTRQAKEALRRLSPHLAPVLPKEGALGKTGAR